MTGPGAGLGEAAAERAPAFVALLMALFVLGEASNTMFVPALPSLVELFAQPESIVQYSLSGYALAFAVGQLVFGPFSDRFGRRPGVLIGLVVFLVGTAVALAAPTIGWLILGRVLQGLGACAGYVVSRAVVRDRFGRQGAAPVMGFLFLCLAIAVILSPVIGGLVVEGAGWQFGFWLQGGAALVLGVVVLFGLTETNLRRDPDALRLGRLMRNYASLFGNPRYLAFMLTHSCAYAGILAFFAGGAFALTDQMGLTRQELGQGLGLVMTGFLVGIVTAMLALRRFGAGIRQLVSISTVLMAVPPLALLAWSAIGEVDLAGLMVLEFVFMFGTGLMAPNTAAGVMLEYPDRAGLAAALLGCMQMAAAAIVTALVSILSVRLGVDAISGAQALLGLATLVLFNLLIRMGGRRDGVGD
ncbi:MAG: multidrug effflux MFS transporter [Sneathiellaceae bacterium]